MQINVTYAIDPNVAPPPAGFFTTVQYAVDILDATFTNNVSMNVVIGWNLFKTHHVARHRRRRNQSLHAADL